MGDIEDRIISEEYKIWKKNTPFMYDFMMTRAVEWPSPTVQWLPDVEILDGNSGPTLSDVPPNGKPDSTLLERIILGTHTINQEQNYLIVASVNLPGYVETPSQNDLYHMREDEFGAFSHFNDKFDLEFKVAHEGLVKCARYMPQHPNIVATKSDFDLFVYDIGDCRADPDNQENCKPIFKFNDLNSCADLSWNGLVEGSLLTCYKKDSIALWDVNLKADKRRWKPKLKFSTSRKDSELKDVSWHHLHPTILGSVSNEGYIFVWDTRSGDTTRASHEVHGHSGPANYIDFNPFSEFVLATASSDRSIALWDLRNLKVKLHSIQNNRNEEFLRVRWSPHNESLLAATNYDRRIYLFDLERIFEEQKPDDADDGQSTLSFVHNGHTSRLYDFSWNLNDPLMICSVSDDNVVQIWQIMNQFFNTKK